MIIPNTIPEWLDERIGFIESLLQANKEITAQNAELVSQCNAAMSDFVYCEALYNWVLEDNTNSKRNQRLKDVATKLLQQTSEALDRQEFRCVYLGGKCFPTEERLQLPKEVIDNIKDSRQALNKLYDQVHALTKSAT